MKRQGERDYTGTFNLYRRMLQVSTEERNYPKRWIPQNRYGYLNVFNFSMVSFSIPDAWELAGKYDT